MRRSLDELFEDAFVSILKFRWRSYRGRWPVVLGYEGEFGPWRITAIEYFSLEPRFDAIISNDDTHMMAPVSAPDAEWIVRIARASTSSKG